MPERRGRPAEEMHSSRRAGHKLIHGRDEHKQRQNTELLAGGEEGKRWSPLASIFSVKQKQAHGVGGWESNRSRETHQTERHGQRHWPVKPQASPSQNSKQHGWPGDTLEHDSTSQMLRRCRKRQWPDSNTCPVLSPLEPIPADFHFSPPSLFPPLIPLHTHGPTPSAPAVVSNNPTAKLHFLVTTELHAAISTPTSFLLTVLPASSTRFPSPGSL